jgi:hypothetical protein
LTSQQSSRQNRNIEKNKETPERFLEMILLFKNNYQMFIGLHTFTHIVFLDIYYFLQTHTILYIFTKLYIFCKNIMYIAHEILDE